jgi:radical SAM protein with 4Fe4S-binding SPASM domain
MTATPPPLPREVQVEVTGACNLRCRMCLVRYRPPLGRVRGSLPLARFRAIVDALPSLRVATLQGLGEPMLAPDLLAMIATAKVRGVEVGFNTNGTLLAPAQARILVALELDWLHVSLDGAQAATHEGIRDGADFAAIVRNLRALADVVAESGRDRPRLAVVFVAMRRNVAELPELVRLVAACGVSRLWVQNLSHSFDDTDPAGTYADIGAFTVDEALWGENDEATAATAFEHAREVASSLGVELRLPRLAPPARPRALGAPGCDWPWRSAYVRHDGKVQPCCMLMGDDRAILGELETTSFDEIWCGERYEAFRAALCTDDPPDVCRGCSMYRGVF